ncbi:MAG: hypothetical protein HF314_14425 [Ignavibacteria bacterium]|jgi:hypothetical protein|nr:hypothetical protein [Ignavibacteria bacterium]MCU7504275.1 hypothetical protein [Ignavibacteria bacterium]MCU7516120.1 hypothetical protein [Ignavibacteria bacterium]
MKAKFFKLSALVFFTVIIMFALNQDINAQHRRVVIKQNHHGYREIIIRDRHYFYREGLFFSKSPKGYIRIDAPVGARVTYLPHGYEMVKIRKETYYIYGGTYYMYFPREMSYVVVKRPV